MNKLNAPQKSILMIVLIVIAFSSFVTMACGPDVNPQPDLNPAAPLIAPAGDTQQAITDWMKSTCEKRADGTCKTMGE